MQAVIDSNSMNHLIRQPKKVKRRGAGSSWEYDHALSKPIQKKKLVLLLDEQSGLMNEWQETCGIEIIETLVSHWEQFDGILLKKVSSLPAGLIRKLRQLGFKNQTIDKVLLKLTFSSVSKNLVSGDRDFWDPKNVALVGDRNASIAKYLRDNFQVEIILHGELLIRCKC